MPEEARFLRVRFQQKSVSPRTMNLERQSRKTRSRAYIEETPFSGQEGGRKQGIKEKLNHGALSVLHPGQIELAVP